MGTSLSNDAHTRRTVLLAAFCIGSFPSCSKTETYPITHVADVNLDPKQYPKLVGALDTEMLTIGLHRFGAAPGLKESVGRDVFYGNYRPALKDNWWFLSVDDVVKSGRLDLRAYATSLKDEGVRIEAISRVAAVLLHFGATLQGYAAPERSSSQGTSRPEVLRGEA